MRTRLLALVATALVALALVAALGMTAGAQVQGSTASTADHGAATATQLQEAPCRARGINPNGSLRGSGVVTGTAAGELIRGSTGGDTISGGGGNDCLVGGGGVDSLDGGDGTDVCIGGPGADVQLTGCEFYTEDN